MKKLLNLLGSLILTSVVISSATAFVSASQTKQLSRTNLVNSSDFKNTILRIKYGDSLTYYLELKITLYGGRPDGYGFTNFYSEYSGYHDLFGAYFFQYLNDNQYDSEYMPRVDVHWPIALNDRLENHMDKFATLGLVRRGPSQIAFWLTQDTLGKGHPATIATWNAFAWKLSHDLIGTPWVKGIQFDFQFQYSHNYWTDDDAIWINNLTYKIYR